MTYCERAHRHGVYGVEKIRVYAAMGKHLCNPDCKLARISAGVVGDDHAAIHRFFAKRLYVAGKPLSGAFDGEHVHTIRA